MDWDGENGGTGLSGCGGGDQKRQAGLKRLKCTTMLNRIKAVPT